MTKTEARKLAKHLGGVRAAANNLGVSTQAFYQWLSGQRPVPQRHADQLRHLASITPSLAHPMTHRRNA